MKEQFHKLASKVSYLVGTPIAFVFAVSAILIWAVLGPLFDFSNTWQLVINTGTTIITFIMVFLIQNTQNRDAKALHLKVDELIRSSRSARDSFIDLEDISDAELVALDTYFKEIHNGQSQHPLSHIHHKVKSEREKRKQI